MYNCWVKGYESVKCLQVLRKQELVFLMPIFRMGTLWFGGCKCLAQAHVISEWQSGCQSFSD